MMGYAPVQCAVHTHSTFCDGKHTMAEMAEAAFAAGVRFYGVSGHAHTPCPSDVGVCMEREPTAYREEALRLRQVYQGRMELLLGIEWDLYSDTDCRSFDYWIGSVHQIYHEESGQYICVDWTPEHLTERCNALFGGSFLALAEAYFRGVERMASMKPPILGHMDLITKFNNGDCFFDTENERYRKGALQAIHAADPVETVLEINTGAMARGYRSVPYPAQFLLREWRSMGGRVILTSDAHHARQILYGYEQAAKWAEAAGYRQAVVLTGSGFVDCPLSCLPGKEGTECTVP